MPQEQVVKRPQEEKTLRLIDRKDLSVEGVKDVVRFEEESILLDTDLGMLEVDGIGLRIAKLDPDRKEIRLTGEVHALFYVENASKKRGMFRR